MLAKGAGRLCLSEGDIKKNQSKKTGDIAPVFLFCSIITIYYKQF